MRYKSSWKLIFPRIFVPNGFLDALLRIARELKTAETWFLARLFILQSSIISQILEFICWTVTIFSFDHMTDENRELSRTLLWYSDDQNSRGALTQVVPVASSAIVLCFRNYSHSINAHRGSRFILPQGRNDALRSLRLNYRVNFAFSDHCHFAGVPVLEGYVAPPSFSWCRLTLLPSFLAAYLSCHCSRGLLP